MDRGSMARGSGKDLVFCLGLDDALTPGHHMAAFESLGHFFLLGIVGTGSYRSRRPSHRASLLVGEDHVMDLLGVALGLGHHRIRGLLLEDCPARAFDEHPGFSHVRLLVVNIRTNPCRIPGTSLVRFYLAGRVQVEGPEGVVSEGELAGRQGRLMLARLVLARGPVSHEQLADLFWRDERPQSWRGTLSPLASRLRTAFDSVGLAGRTMLIARHGAYELVIPQRWVDIEEAIRSLDRAEGQVSRGAAVDAWPDGAVASAILRRPFLEGEDHPWVVDWRSTLTESLVRSLACLSEAWLASKRWPLAEAVADESIRIDPFREVAHRHRIRALAGAGNGARALQAYRQLEVLLADALGASPSPETEALYEELLGISPRE